MKTVALVFSLLLNIGFLVHSWQSHTVVSVPDGDSLQLKDGRRIRLLGINAPERGRCMADEARETLLAIALHKRVTLQNIATDDFGRQLAHVFISGTNINETLVSNGLARSSSGFTEAQSIAKENHLGIWSETCRKTSNPECDIKGNIKSGKKVYHLPTCDHYALTIIDTSYGDMWFCSEDEAKKAGFTKASGCSD